MARMNNKELKQYALVKLYKDKYNRREVSVTVPTEQLPRLLVVKIHVDTRTAIVKYPSGIVNKVGLECISNSSIINPDNPKYKMYCAESAKLVEHEANRNNIYKNILTNVGHPMPVYKEPMTRYQPWEPLVKAVEPEPEPEPTPFIVVIDPVLPKQDTSTLLAASIMEQRKTNLLLERLCNLWETNRK